MTDPSLVQATELYDQAATEAAPADGVISGPFQYDASYDPNIYYFEVAWDCKFQQEISVLGWLVLWRSVGCLQRLELSGFASLD